MNKKLILPIAIGLILVIFLIWYLGFYKKSVAPTSTGGAPIGPGGASPPANSQSLGSELYEKSKNPIGDKLPEANPVPNPIEGVYKNPFAE
ncbi:MAG: hypothetical protein HYT13_01045 [Candidatus Liptonbacteria bacterium]|nr:hypothetical protein [Candidatus Liptonbacteria bacterium]